FTKQFSSIYLVGHSLGCPSILKARHSAVQSVVFWEPSFTVDKFWENDLIYIEAIDQYILNWGIEYLVSKKMIDQCNELDDRLFSHFQKPTKIICAELGILHKVWKEKIDNIKVQHDYC